MRRPSTVPAARRASATVSPTAHEPSAAGTATSARRAHDRQRSRPTEGDERSDGLRRATLESRPPRRRLEITTGRVGRASGRASAIIRRVRPAGVDGRCGSSLVDRRRRLVDRLPARAPAQVGTERTIDGASSSPVSPVSPVSPARRTMIPGVQNPHLASPVATWLRPSDRHRLVQSGEGGDPPPTNPGHGVTHATRLSVDENGAASALPLRAAAVLGRALTEPFP